MLAVIHQALMCIFHVYITAMINYVFISFSTVHIYNISYIHLQTLYLLLFYLQKWVCICVFWHAGVHQTIFRSRCRDDVVSGLTRSRGWSYTGQTSIIRTWSQGLICVQKIRRHLDIVFHAAKRFATTQVLATETRTQHEITFFYRWCNVFLVSTLWSSLELLFCLWRFAGMQYLQNGLQAPKMALFVFGYVIVVLIWRSS